MTNKLSVVYEQTNGTYLVMRGPVIVADCGRGMSAQAEASTIVSCVNSHESLKAFLKAFIDYENAHDESTEAVK